MNHSPKIRGWKRRVRQLDQWLEKYKTPDLPGPENRTDAYVKIWIDPWFRLQKRNPPAWYFKLILDRFSLMYDQWQIAFSHASYPFDLQLWLFENNTIESELVCTRVDEVGQQRNNYFESCEVKRDFPVKKFDARTFKSTEWNWSLFYAGNHYFEKMDELKPEEIQNLRDHGFEEKIIFPGKSNEDRHFWKPYDFVWVGRKK
ncbi:MAG: hypothetical protein R3D00_13585 [Bacteroidia bacterium]